MKPIISLARRDAILALSNKRTQAICTLMENNHVDDFYTILDWLTALPVHRKKSATLPKPDISNSLISGMT